ncbi:hypothetical protein [Croceimicrobium hydrocarbonivorans]|uniref:Lipoprotein n=1 Tax=Croceimicrobium hydrocarbonivorans TaxID=2761580 RepID=A0A7H0VHF7_9FLAO|nr:hypothetical protein [Croceimicrobium hydrocarbonivorans]QNR25155.1 hypothetical protein H4K34_04770 [Croceimicrobium hydrocarbonivorans]
MKSIHIALLVFFISSCQSEYCKIDFQNNVDSFNEAVHTINALNLKSDSKNPHFRIVKTFSKETSSIDTAIFKQIDFIECHEDGTIIFQAPNCNKENGFRDLVYFVAYSPQGKIHIERKRNIGQLKNIEGNWFSGAHINSLAN